PEDEPGEESGNVGSRTPDRRPSRQRPKPSSTGFSIEDAGEEPHLKRQQGPELARPGPVERLLSQGGDPVLQEQTVNLQRFRREEALDD
ncbi:MAG: hypothetical protein CO064_05495, partial [Anaerolineae bacterium CG_4_9_14_0_8_um_filter_58_9]